MYISICLHGIFLCNYAPELWHHTNWIAVPMIPHMHVFSSHRSFQSHFRQRHPFKKTQTLISIYLKEFILIFIIIVAGNIFIIIVVLVNPIYFDPPDVNIAIQWYWKNKDLQNFDFAIFEILWIFGSCSNGVPFWSHLQFFGGSITLKPSAL